MSAMDYKITQDCKKTELSSRTIMTSQSTLYDVMRENGNFGIFLSLIDAAHIADDLSEAQDLTVFAPSDSAFFGLEMDRYRGAWASENSAEVVQFVRQFIVPKQARASRFEGRRTWASTSAGPKFLIKGSNTLTYEGAEVTRTDILASNGILHVIDTMIASRRFFLPFGRVARPGMTARRVQTAPPTASLLFA